MSAQLSIRRTHGLPLTHCREFFSVLEAPDAAALQGVHQAEFTGPAWVRQAAGPALVLSRFGGWWGKAFLDPTHGVNLFQRNWEIQRGFPFQLETRPSVVDGRPSLFIRYQPDSPLPWPYMADELRRLDAASLLGMTYLNLGGLKRYQFPFLLHFVEELV